MVFWAARLNPLSDVSGSAPVTPHQGRNTLCTLKFGENDCASASRHNQNLAKRHNKYWSAFKWGLLQVINNSGIMVSDRFGADMLVLCVGKIMLVCMKEEKMVS